MNQRNAIAAVPANAWHLSAQATLITRHGRHTALPAAHPLHGWTLCLRQTGLTLGAISLHNQLKRLAASMGKFSITEAERYTERGTHEAIRGWLEQLRTHDLIGFEVDRRIGPCLTVHTDPNPDNAEHKAAIQLAQEVWG